MIFKVRSKRMLKYEKTKSKLREFSVDKTEYPKFQLKSSDLLYTTIYALSTYCEKYHNFDYEEFFDNSKEDLKIAAQYFDYAVQSEEDLSYSNNLLLLGAVTYFILENFGNAKVLIGKINEEYIETSVEKLIYQILFILLFNSPNKVFSSEITQNIYDPIINSFRGHFSSGDTFDNIINNYNVIREKMAHSNEIFSVTYLDFLGPIIIIAQEYSSWNFLPKWTEMTEEGWDRYLNLDHSIHLLWPAQKMIIQEGVLQNQNCVVPLPTGVGKTRSFELLAYYKLIIQDRNNIVIIAPLRALCNEITTDLKFIFKDFSEIAITKFTDVYQEDTFFKTQKKNIIIATPEKFVFVLRHAPNLINYIDLFIFDEAHLFDDSSRGVDYELLVTEINRLANQNSQMVLYSAILSNSHDISNWLFGEEKNLSNSTIIATSNKSVGYIGNNTQIHFYERGESLEESYFVPNIVESVNLNINNNNFQKWFFPRTRSLADRKIDLCIYFTNKLVSNGAAATFVGKPASIKTIMSRMIEISSRQDVLTNQKQQTNKNEISKFKKLFSLHYDEDHIYTKTVSLGTLPHYANLIDGVREAIEYSIKIEDFKSIICTSTLAEGINIPIKYLLVHSLSQGRGKMENRKIANLIGRTARSGMHTEGTILLLDENLYERRNSDYQNKQKWLENREAFSNLNVEECKSKILSLVEPFSPDYGRHTATFQLISDILKIYYPNNNDWKIDFREEFSSLSNHLSLGAQATMQQIASNVFKVVNSLENYLSFIYAEVYEDEVFEEIVEDIAENTFAMYLATKSQREILLEIFNIIGDKVQQTLDNNNEFYYSKSLYGFDISTKIFEWTKINEEKLTTAETNVLIEKLFMLFFEIFENELEYDSIQYLSSIYDWIANRNIIHIQKHFEIDNFQKIEKLIRKIISYDFTFFIGSILDAVSESNEVLPEKLKRVQKMIKYGVRSSFSIEFCEKIINDRMIANVIAKELNISDTESQIFSSVIKYYSDSIILLLEDYPKYYKEKFELYLKSV
ncbi:DEAD/DEAH box helicase [Enterococcus sp. DIV0802b]|uniref:DEAD/DEAH box helicase n=1 Tax=Enterococcus sp. DIV0802b TaxID=2774704 RepID=UPI003D2FDF00